MGTNRYSNFPASFVHAGGTLTLLQLQGTEVRSGLNLDRVIAGGAIDPSANLMLSADPRSTIQTHDLLTALTTISISSGLWCSGGCTIRRQLRGDGGSGLTFIATGETYSATKGFLHCTGVSASQGQPAVGDFEFISIYDGSTYPFVPNASVDISGVTSPAFTSKYSLGPVYIGSSPISGIISASVRPGISFEPFADSGQIFAKQGSIVARMPTIQFVTVAEDFYGTVGNFFMAAAASAVKVYFLKMVDASNARAALDAGNHVKFTGATGALCPENTSVQDNGNGTLTVTMPLTGTLACSVASTVP